MQSECHLSNHMAIEHREDGNAGASAQNAYGDIRWGGLPGSSRSCGVDAGDVCPSGVHRGHACARDPVPRDQASGLSETVKTEATTSSTQPVMPNTIRQQRTSPPKRPVPVSMNQQPLVTSLSRYSSTPYWKNQNISFWNWKLMKLDREA